MTNLFKGAESVRKITALFAVGLMLASTSVQAQGRRGHHPRLTPEERAQLKSMTPEQRQAFRQKKAEDRIASLPPEKQAEARARWEKRKARMAERKAKWDAMTPEQREKFKAERRGRRGHGRGRWGRKGFQHMTPEQRAAHRAKHKAFWDSLTPQEKAEFKAMHGHRRGDGRGHGGRHGRWADSGSGHWAPSTTTDPAREAQWQALSPEERAAGQAQRDKWLSILNRQ